MAALRKLDIHPRDSVSTTAIPEAIREALHFIFQNVAGGVWFVGGSALSGYYAEHRISDDIDLFTAGHAEQESAVRAVKALTGQKAILTRESSTPLFYRADVKSKNHSFTVSVVLDENVHRVGHALRTQDGVWVADFQTLLSMKLACLVSRCSEKDLFDLEWMFGKAGFPSAEEIISMGQRMDSGLNLETLIVSIAGTALRKEACKFLLPTSELTVDSAYQKIVKLQKVLLEMFLDYEKTAPLSAEAKALLLSVKDIKKSSIP